MVVKGKAQMKKIRGRETEKPSRLPREANGQDTKDDESNPIDIAKKKFFKWINTRFGWRLSAFIAIVFLIAVTLWTNWDSVRKLPGYQWIRIKIEDRLPIVKAKGNRYTILLSRLDNDEDGRLRRTIADSLTSHFEKNEIEVLLPNRVIRCCEVEEPQVAIDAARKRAKEILIESDADAIIWGTALEGKTDGPIRLYWTVKEKSESYRWTRKYVPESRSYDLPPLFWADLDDVLHILIATEASAYIYASAGKYIAENITPFSSKVKALVNGGSLSERAQLPIRKILADTLLILGTQNINREDVADAVANYRTVLAINERLGDKLAIAKSNSQLAAALLATSKVVPEVERSFLVESTNARLKALEFFTEKDHPIQWAFENLDLAIVQSELGRVENSVYRFEVSLMAFQEALSVIGKSGSKIDKAVLGFNLGVTLTLYGMMRQDLDTLRAAEKIQKESISNLREMKWLWAAGNENLAKTLTRIGEQEKSTEKLSEAVAAYKNALTEFSKARSPSHWASIHLELSYILWIIGERTHDTKPLRESVVAGNDALSVFTLTDFPREFAGVQKNLGNTLTAIGALENNVGMTNAGIAAYNKSINAFIQVKDKNEEELTRRNLEITMARMKQTQ
jgi:tetratricopeptide (TPR) repeat protein